MEFSGIEYALLPVQTRANAGAPPRDKNKAKNPKVWLAGELIVRAERQRLTSLPPQLLLKTSIRKLVLTDNDLDSLPPQLFLQLKELREVCVGHNRLTQLPAEVAQLQHLETLDLSHNQLEVVPSALCRCAHLKLLNLDGNPLSATLRALWQQPQEQPTAAAAVGDNDGAGAQADGSSSSGKSRAHNSKQSLQRLHSNTQAVLDHLLQQQDPGTQQLVQQARLAVLQEATRARLAKQLRCADPDSLQECQQLAADAQLGADVLGRVQAMQHASTALQAAVEKLKQQQQKQKQGVGVGDGVGSDTSELQAQLKAAHKQVEELCKPGRPTGALHATAHGLLKQLQRQQLDKGWRCAVAAGAAASGGDKGAEEAVTPQAAAAADAAGSSSLVPISRRFLTSAERKRQHLTSHGARSHQEWALIKQQQEHKQKQMLKDLARAEVEGRVKVVADRAARAVENCERERQWPSKRSSAYPPGTFRLDPDALRAVRAAYYKPPLVARAAAPDAAAAAASESLD